MPNSVSNAPDQESRHLPDDVTLRLRALSHDLSNSLETILQAGYLLEQAKLPSASKKWAAMIEKATQEAARINREIRATLHSQGPGSPKARSLKPEA